MPYRAISKLGSILTSPAYIHTHTHTHTRKYILTCIYVSHNVFAASVARCHFERGFECSSFKAGILSYNRYAHLDVRVRDVSDVARRCILLMMLVRHFDQI